MPSLFSHACFLNATDRALYLSLLKGLDTMKRSQAGQAPAQHGKVAVAFTLIAPTLELQILKYWRGDIQCY